jgi:hypothetical protein
LCIAFYSLFSVMLPTRLSAPNTEFSVLSFAKPQSLSLPISVAVSFIFWISLVSVSKIIFGKKFTLLPALALLFAGTLCFMYLWGAAHYMLLAHHLVSLASAVTLGSGLLKIPILYWLFSVHGCIGVAYSTVLIVGLSTICGVVMLFAATKWKIANNK